MAVLRCRQVAFRVLQSEAFPAAYVANLRRHLSSGTTRQILPRSQPWRSRKNYSTTQPSLQAEVWSFNLRTEFRESEDGPNGWSQRRHGVAELIGTRRPAVVCVQEATEPMLEFLTSQIGSQEYSWAAISRTPGKKDEAAGFLFDRRRVDLQDHEATWLSPPDVPRGEPAWDAACSRTFETATFRIRKSVTEEGMLRILNTHFDHVGVQARTSSAKMIAAAVERAAAKFPHCAQVVCGDFNSPKGFGNAAYEALTSPGASGVALRDAARNAKECGLMPVSTIHKFEGVDFESAHGDGTVDLSGEGTESLKGEPLAPDARHIDWLLWRDSLSGLRLRPLRYEVITDRLVGPARRYPSDHYPLSTTFELQLGS